VINFAPLPGTHLVIHPLILRLLPALALLITAAGLPAAGANAQPGVPPRDLLPAALEAGLENVTADSTGLAYENRRYRHPLDAIGRLPVESVGRRRLFERRLGLTSAAFVARDSDVTRFDVLYPSDRHFPRAPRGRMRASTHRSLDFIAGPLISYEVGRLTDPLQMMFQMEARAEINPWAGALLAGSVVFPVYNDFSESDDHPDVNEVRPGIATLEQYAWIPKVALASATAGIFADNRYGVSFGAARPLAQGAVLLDSQVDYTGFIAFNTDGIKRTDPEDLTGFGGITWRPPWRDMSLRLRGGRFVYGDDGAEVQFLRSFGDFDIAFFAIRAGGLDVEGVRLGFPIPPLTRPTQSPVRALPIQKFSLSYRTDATPVGAYLYGPASRETFLRQLDGPSLATNRYRLERARGAPKSAPSPIPRVSNAGMTGFINTPWAGGMGEGEMEIGYVKVPKKWAYSSMGVERGVYSNEIYYGSLGLLPRTEIGLRFTRTPGLKTFGNIDPDSRLTTDTDHMASIRFTVFEPKDRVPGVALGVEDVEGTRRHHASYVVFGVPSQIFSVQSRFSLGYASRVFAASRHVLDGAFGAIEVSPWRVVATQVEYDTEKWNVGLGVDLGFGLRLRAAALNFESLSAGVGWCHRL